MDPSHETVVLDQLLLSAARTILKRVLSLFTAEILHSRNILQHDLKQIHKSLTRILAVLQDAEDYTITIRSFSIWVHKLMDATYEVEDVVDDLAYQNLKLKVPNSNPFFQRLLFPKNAFNFELAQKVSTLNKSLHEIENEATSFGLDIQFKSRDRNMIEVDLDRVTDGVFEDAVVGRETDVLKIVSFLALSCVQQVLTFVPIVGIHGLGKTTLAKLVCEQVMSRKLFDVKIWLSCYQTSYESLETILRKMLQSLIGAVKCPTDTDAILQQLKKELARKRFILVLDNVWITDSQWWDALKTRLLEVCSNNGSVVLVTSSHEEVASVVDGTSTNSVDILSDDEEVASIVHTSAQHRYTHKLDILTHDECWFIMKEMAFRNTTAQIPRNLENIGRQIAKCCKGVPIVAKVLGGAMGFNIDEEAWLMIRDRIAFFENHFYRDHLLSPQEISFDQLPSYLKLSFTFCFDFPKGFPIRKEELIQLWMVEGITDSCELGNKYFGALLEKTFFHDVEMSDDGEVVRCKIPDILPYYASVRDNNVIRRWMIRSTLDTSYGHHTYVDYQHLTFPALPYDWDRTFQKPWKLKSTRSLCYHGDDIEELPSSVGELRHLRYLSVSDTKIRELPESITKLYHLQTLNLSNSTIKTLPESIFELFNLRTLNLSFSNMIDFPESITKLRHLQTLNISNTNITELPESIGTLQNLQTFNASHTNITEFPGSISKLQNLQTLNVSNSNIKELPNSMATLQNLTTLDVSNSNIVVLPEFITKLDNLQTLNVSNCSIKEFPESITNLRKLQTLKFLGCKELSEFPKKEMNNLINLKNISFSYEHQMPFGLGHLTCLQTLPYFVVGSDLGGSIGELEFLNELRDQLEITRLEEVQDKEEAKRANLQGKTRIQGLDFQWSYGDIDRITSDEELLEGLQPNPSIKRIKIKYYMGVKWPSWMFKMKTSVHSLAAINNLVDLVLEQCWNIVQLPCLGDLPCLKFLIISHMGRVKFINKDLYGIDIAGSSCRSLREFPSFKCWIGNLTEWSSPSDGRRVVLFPSLKSLSVSWMENLIEWSSPSDGSRVVVFPCLENLSIQSCPKLASFPFTDLSALVKIDIKDCEDLWFIFHKQQSFSYLTSLSIAGCPKSTELGNWLLSKQCFREFSIRRCQWLIFIPEDLGMLRSLSSLAISCCNRLKYFSEEILCRLTQLKRLSIGAFSKELDDFFYMNRINELPWLEELEVWGSDCFCREMSLLPNQLQHLTALKSLKIIGFTAMEVLPEWLTNLQSLESLSLSCCRKLGCQSTATIIQQLPDLAGLYINYCPVLEESDSELLQSLNTNNIKVEFSHARA